MHTISDDLLDSCGCSQRRSIVRVHVIVLLYATIGVHNAFYFKTSLCGTNYVSMESIVTHTRCCQLSHVCSKRLIEYSIEGLGINVFVTMCWLIAQMHPFTMVLKSCHCLVASKIYYYYSLMKEGSLVVHLTLGSNGEGGGGGGYGGLTFKATILCTNMHCN